MFQRTDEPLDCFIVLQIKRTVHVPVRKYLTKVCSVENKSFTTAHLAAEIPYHSGMKLFCDSFCFLLINFTLIDRFQQGFVYAIAK